MPLLSQLLDRPVLDVNGRRVGRLIDVVACVDSVIAYPSVVALVVKRAKTLLVVPFSVVELADAPAIPLNKPFCKGPPYESRADDLYLVWDVLGKEILDKNGVRVARVHDLGRSPVRTRLGVTSVHGSGPGTPQRFGVESLARVVAAWLNRTPTGQVIPWGAVEWRSDHPMLREV